MTDPPYGRGSEMWRSRTTEWSKLWSEQLSWDSEAPVDLVVDAAQQFPQAIVWGGNYFPLPPSRGWLVWDKIVRNFSSGHCELAWSSLNQPVRAFNYCNAQLKDEGKFHPTQKPLRLMQWCVNFTSGVVADPFAGSGTTLVAARNLGRQAIGVELDERYCELTARRLDQMCLDFGADAG